jgi:FMN phosphatase YigB (HAD superfamily)
LLIIFDLDDTLIDTYGAVAPFQIERAISILLSRPLTASERQEIQAAIDKEPSTKDVLKRFCIKRSLDEKLGCSLLQMLLPDDYIVPTLPDAKKMLQEVSSKVKIALVTIGNKDFQLDKLKKAGLEDVGFSKIITTESDKKPHFKQLETEFNEDPSNIWVCGDRVETDLKPADELGFHTVQILWGRSLRLPLWKGTKVNKLIQLKELIS